MKERILKLLVNGVKPAQIAEVVGCSASYISQLLIDPVFKEELSEALLNQPEDADEKALDVKYEATEHRVLAAINSKLSDAKLGELTRTLEVIAKRQTEVKKINAIAKAPAKPGVQIVNLTMPAVFMKQQSPAIEMNSQSEVIAIGGKNLAPLQADGVKNLFERLKEAKLSASSLAPAIETELLEAVGENNELPADF